MSTATYAQLTAEIASNIPSGAPATLTAASLRRYLQDQIDSLNVAASTTGTVNLSTYQPFNNTASATAAAVLMQIYDGTQGVTWGQLNSTAHAITIIAQASTAVASTASQAMLMSSTSGLGIYFASGQPTVSTAAAGSLCLSTGGSGPSTRAWVAGSTGTWIGLVAES